MKVAILTMFSNLDRTYSLVNVVAEHLAMLLAADVKTKVLVCEGFPHSERTGIFTDPRLEWEEITNTLDNKQITWYDYCQPSGEVHDTFYREVEVIAQDMIEKLSDINVCIMHDIHFQGWHLIHNVAIRKAQEQLPHVKFIAFTHSAPFNRPNNPQWPFAARYSPMPKTTYVFPSQAGIPYLAKQYNVAEGKCRVINNSLNLFTYMSPDVQKLAEQIDILSPDILMVYPTRLTPGKRLEKVAALAGAIKKTSENKIKVIYCDFPSGDIDPETYKDLIRKTGYDFGLEENDIYFTTELGYPHGFPRQGVMDLFTLSNLFIFPSYSEAFPLILLEAASRGNFLVVNERVPALEEIGKNIHAYFMRWDARNFGYDTHENYVPSEQTYLEEHATRIVNLMRENSVLFAKTLVRQRYSPYWIWENQFKPLLEG